LFVEIHFNSVYQMLLKVIFLFFMMYAKTIRKKNLRIENFSSPSQRNTYFVQPVRIMNFSDGVAHQVNPPLDGCENDASPLDDVIIRSRGDRIAQTKITFSNMRSSDE